MRVMIVQPFRARACSVNLAAHNPYETSRAKHGNIIRIKAERVGNIVGVCALHREGDGR